MFVMAMMQGGMLILFCAMFVGTGIVMYRKGVAENDVLDMEIEGSVCGTEMTIGTPMLPGYGRLTILYADPYDGSMHKYHLTHDLRLKKYPIGSPYKLMYSRTSRQAYERESNQTNRRIGMLFLFVGIGMIVAVLVRLGYLAMCYIG